MLPPELGEAAGVARGRGIGEQALHLGRARERLVEPVAKAQAFFPVAYFCRKRSTRPAVSISFCFPVKNG